MAQHPERLLTNLWGIKRIFWGVLYPDQLSSRWHQAALLFWRILLLPFAVGFLLYPLARGSDRPSWVLAAALFGSMLAAVYFGNPGEERYLAPYAFLLFLWGSASLAAITEKIASLCGSQRAGRYTCWSFLGWGVIAGLLTLLVAARQQFTFPRSTVPRSRWEVSSISHVEVLESYRLAAAAVFAGARSSSKVF